VAEQIWDDMAITSDERLLARVLVRTVAHEHGAIDAALADVTMNWRLERLGAIERSILRLAAAELLRGEVPPRVVILEGVRLAERYGSEQSARFVNGVLDALARRMGRL
jgi:N utilization substance protein B